MNDSPSNPPPLVELLQHASANLDFALPTYFAPDGHAGRVSAELDRLHRGEIPPIRADIDPLQAFIVICYLEPTLGNGTTAQGLDASVRRFINDLEEAMRRVAPELAGVLAHGRRNQPTGGAR